MEARRGRHLSWNWSYSEYPVWVLGTKPRPFARVTVLLTAELSLACFPFLKPPIQTDHGLLGPLSLDRLLGCFCFPTVRTGRRHWHCLVGRPGRGHGWGQAVVWVGETECSWYWGAVIAVLQYEADSQHIRQTHPNLNLRTTEHLE